MPVTCPLVRLTKPLAGVANTQPVNVRTFQVGDDRAWLRLHHRCFLVDWAPPWDETDFAREFLHRDWWQPARMAFALAPSGRHAIGTVTLAGAPARLMQISWLAVDPHYRRRGVGQQLLTWAEHSCWILGGRRLVAETLTAWPEAVAFYRSMGYQ